MGFIVVNRAEILGHDTALPAATSADIRYDAEVALATVGLSSPDPILAVRTEGSRGHDLSIILREATVVDTLTPVASVAAWHADTRGVVSVVGQVACDASLIINPPTYFTHASGAVYFPYPPSRPGGREVTLAQIIERDSQGETYVYTKGAGRIRHRLDFTRVDDGTLAALQEFVRSTVKGLRSHFVWAGTDGSQHVVRLENQDALHHRKTGPNRHRVEISLIEEVGL